MTITISLAPEIEEMIREQASRSGQSIADYVQHLVEREVLAGHAIPDGLRQQLFEELRRDIALGIEQADRGQVGPFNACETLTRIRQRTPEAW